MVTWMWRSQRYPGHKGTEGITTPRYKLITGSADGDSEKEVVVEQTEDSEAQYVMMNDDNAQQHYTITSDDSM